MQNFGRSNMKPIIDYLNDKETVFLRVYKILCGGKLELISLSTRVCDIGIDSVNLELLLRDTLESIGGKYLITHATKKSVILADILYGNGNRLHCEGMPTLKELSARG